MLPVLSQFFARLILYYLIAAFLLLAGLIVLCHYSFSVVDLQFLVEADLYESPDESARREEVLGKLDQVATLVATRVLMLNTALSFPKHALLAFADCKRLGEAID